MIAAGKRLKRAAYQTTGTPMKKIIVGVAAALSLMTSNAVADGPYKRPARTVAAPVAAPPPPTWTGFYLGAGVGAGAVVHDATVDDEFLGRILNFDGVGAHGALGTVIIGWDWQTGPNTVFGVFTDFDFTNLSHDHSVLDDLFRNSIDYNGTWSIGARLGWLSSPSVLWYVTGGYTQADFDVSPRFFDLRFSGDDSLSGYFVGGGVDTRLAASNWFLRMEYRFSQFDSETFVSEDGFTRADFEPSTHTARLTLTYKFGGGHGWGSWGQ
jgi:outer membrane immunogenic protein